MSQRPKHANVPLSHVDATWLSMDTSQGTYAITAVLTFAGAVPFDSIERVVRERLLTEPRFRQRVRAAELPLRMPCWELDPDFDLALHLFHLRLPLPSGRAELTAWLGPLTSTSLARDRPLWQLYVLDEVEGNTLLVARLHHCIADGISLVRLLHSVCDAVQGEPAHVGLAPSRAAAARRLQLGRLAEQAKVATELMLLPDEPPTPLRGKLGYPKLVAWSSALSLQDAKRVAESFQGKVNDVLQSCVAGAVRRYLLAHDALPRAEEVRSFVPIYFQGDEGSSVGNHIALVYLALPILTEQPLARARQVKERMDVLKNGEAAAVAYATFSAFAVLGSEVTQRGSELLARKASLLTTNLPGPASRVTMAGHAVTSIVVWAPPGTMSVGFTMISYAGELRLGVAADKRLIPDPERLVEAFEAEFADLCGQGRITCSH